MIAVRAAFDAVEIFDVPENPGPAPFPPVNAPDSTVMVFYSAAYSGYYLGRRELALGDPAQGSFLTYYPVAPTKPYSTVHQCKRASSAASDGVVLADTAASSCSVACCISLWLEEAVSLTIDKLRIAS